MAKNATAEQIGLNVRKFRKARKWTQQQLADAVELDFRTISRIETGKALPPIPTLEIIGDKLDVSVNELLAGVTVSKGEIAAEIESLLVDLPPKWQIACLEMLRAAAKALK